MLGLGLSVFGLGFFVLGLGFFVFLELGFFVFLGLIFGWGWGLLYYIICGVVPGVEAKDLLVPSFTRAKVLFLPSLTRILSLHNNISEIYIKMSS